MLELNIYKVHSYITKKRSIVVKKIRILPITQRGKMSKKHIFEMILCTWIWNSRIKVISYLGVCLLQPPDFHNHLHSPKNGRKPFIPRWWCRSEWKIMRFFPNVLFEIHSDFLKVNPNFRVNLSMQVSFFSIWQLYPLLSK